MRLLRLQRLGAYPVYLILSGVSSFCFARIFTVNLVYQVKTAGLNPLQLVLVGTALESVIFVGEVPTGVVADVYSRRLSVIIGIFITGLGFLVEGSVPRFATIVLGQALWGVGETFVSGAREAWIVDEVGETRAGAVFLRAAQAGQLGALLGIGASAALATIRLNLPILLGGAGFLLVAVFLLLTMPEHGFTPVPRGERSSWQAMSETLHQGLRLVRGRPILLSILAIGVFTGMFSEGVDRLGTAHLLRDVGLPKLGRFEPVTWFGVIAAGAMLLGIVATEIARRRVDTTAPRQIARALLGINAMLVASVVVFALARSFSLALGAYWLGTLLRNTSGPLYGAWLNQSIDSRVRATVLSMSGQIDALGQIAGGPLIGLVGTVISVPAALLGSAVLLLPALPLSARAGRQGSPTRVMGDG